ncbi:Fur family zinc uptake transcriptional regulator [Microvirga lupini]|uniref:Fur family zinc uptake transcriptional regulator n=1 Tax=Microvirga lupini TaxID=420324 RepID=A0A7W4YVP5_9HYPH|nr:Fur family transcriptional regulator [Microvirga lupini]MBB3017183.1 Fur family zinc uptake transcriptional regulator [Microvirga lupini]
MVHAPSLQHQLPSDNARIQASLDSGTRNTLAETETLCRTRGVRLTPIRRRVLEVLLGAAKPLGAYDLADVLASQGRRMAPITVYRALDFLIEQGLAHRLASRNAYIASTGSRGTPAFLICEACGEATEITCPDVAETVHKVLANQGYQPLSRALEITGRCPHCQDVH